MVLPPEVKRVYSLVNKATGAIGGNGESSREAQQARHSAALREGVCLAGMDMIRTARGIVCMMWALLGTVCVCLVCTPYLPQDRLRSSAPNFLPERISPSECTAVPCKIMYKNPRPAECLRKKLPLIAALSLI